MPSIAFVEVYQEILAVWCGNYWRRSSAVFHLQPFMASLGTEQIRDVAKMFASNERVRAELFQERPKRKATTLLEELKARLTVEAHKAEIDETIRSVMAL